MKSPVSEVLFANSYADLSFHIGNYSPNALWIVDETTAKMVRPLPEPNVILPSGEKSKSWDSIALIVKEASRNRLGRDSRFIGFGGGVICDLAAFAASIYMRGCRLTLIPTTLLAMADASLGGKTGINHCNTKNLIGSFYPAEQILICPATLASLPPNEFHNGLAEVIKHSILTKNDALYLLMVQSKNQILSRNMEVLKKLLLLSLQVKKEYIQDDPDDKLGIRAALNFGHTFGHALESHNRMASWSHGEAVAWGMGIALDAGLKLGITESVFAEGVKKLLLFYGFDINYRLNRGEWLDYKDRILTDKKKTGGKIHFILLKQQGEHVSQTLEMNLVRDLVIQRALS